jgi:adenine C2-methylase RlmN of 23S rRNA A2503 and tRNA A37
MASIRSRIGENMKYISNAKYGEPVETGTIYRGDNKRLVICVHTLCGCGETLYMNCQTLGIVDRKLNSTSVIAAINEAQSLVKREFDLLSNELNTILNGKIEISRY